MAEDGFFNSGVHTAWDGSVVEYRSSYELDLCRALDAGKILYRVECMTVDYYDSVLKRRRFAVPDFYLPDHNTIIEVKSSFTFDRQNMIDKAEAYMENGYDFVLEYEHRSYSYSDMLSLDDRAKNIKYYAKAKPAAGSAV